tara:strand:+ start:6424 stop:6543 length:120 start_codon:yes stop_codon:yes gene_type:complete
MKPTFRYCIKRLVFYYYSIIILLLKLKYNKGRAKMRLDE